ncbi:non-histone chromosomal protein HMG-17 [Latimeria chalumnae]|uniref:non-histone chromosomal protein HMG-17 n=1 Tax=Latimeria chalumnae TaxID=7897 RepID=UPI0003C16AE2|nr:PREDICTED: non-histone chromosomal protein HMG-17 [Latimeria chalumnae]|eukprot:XP_005991062.1 PREDICTED: non-histone chromosomal protein HMG-17 [Latimeria chalumnae]
MPRKKAEDISAGSGGKAKPQEEAPRRKSSRLLDRPRTEVPKKPIKQKAKKAKPTAKKSPAENGDTKMEQAQEAKGSGDAK